MLNNLEYGYSLNPAGEKFVFTMEECEELRDISPSHIIYEFLGAYKKDKLEFTNAIVVSGEQAVLDRANFLKSTYGLEYHDTFKKDEVVYVRYIYPSPIKKGVVNHVADKLSEVFGIPIKTGISIPKEGNKQTFEFTVIKPLIIESILNRKNSDSGIGNINRATLNSVNMLPIRDVMDAIGIKNLVVDDILNITTEYGNVFATVAGYYQSNDVAIETLNKEFACGFLDANESAKIYRSQGIDITSGSENFITNKGGYFRQSDDGELKRVTDFTVKVHSIFKLATGEKKFVVSLCNEQEGVEVKNIIWENSANKGKLSDFVQKFGSFHFHGSNNDVILMHTLISKTDAPIVDTVIGYGWHYSKDICLFANGVYNAKTKSFTETEKNHSGILFKDDGDGIIPVDPNGNQIGIMLAGKTAVCNVPNKKYEPKDFIEHLSGLWNDDTGIIIFLMACGIVGSGLFKLRKDVPMYFIRGITQSGKTTFCEILQRLVGYPLNAAETFGGTLFTSLLLLSSANNIPVFFTESRRNSKQIKEKIESFRSCYDRMPVGRGRADMSAASFHLNAIPVMEGEEMIGDGATRTRCVQFRPEMKSKLSTKIVFEEKLEKARCIDYFTYSFLTHADENKFNKYRESFMELFSDKANGRNVYNLSILFASAMCYYPELEDTYYKSLNRLVEFQNQDEIDNGTSIDIIKSISAFIQKGEYPIYFRKDGMVISWEAIQEYSRKYRQELSLDISSYKEHLNSLGHTVDFYEVYSTSSFDSGELLVEGPFFKFKDIDKRLLGNPEVYAQYKAYQQRII